MIENEKIDIDIESNIENEIISKFSFHVIDKLYIKRYDSIYSKMKVVKIKHLMIYNFFRIS